MLIAGELPAWWVRALAFLLGATWGSFANVLIYRFPREMSVVKPGSHCFACNAPVAPYDNIPIVSYVLLRGRCRRCGAKFSPRYAIVELLFALVSVAIAERLFTGANGSMLPAWAAGLHWASRFAAAFALLVTAFIDLDEMLVPWFTKVYALAPLAAAWLLPPVAPTPTLAGAVAGAALGYLGLRILFIDGYKLLTGRRGMGLGDAEVLVLVGALLGLPGVVFTLGAGAVQGLVATGVVVLFRGRIGPSFADEVEDEDEDEDEDESDERDSQREGASRGESEERRAASLEKSEESPKGDLARDVPEASAAKPRRRVPLKVPFVPFLALAALEYLLGADQLVNTYLRAFGGE